MTSFGTSTFVLGVQGANLNWSRAISITYAYDVTTLYMYTVMAGAGEVMPCGFVSGLPQFTLNTTISAPYVILTRILTKPESGYQGPF